MHLCLLQGKARILPAALTREDCSQEPLGVGTSVFSCCCPQHRVQPGGWELCPSWDRAQRAQVPTGQYLEMDLFHDETVVFIVNTESR